MLSRAEFRGGMLALGAVLVLVLAILTLTPGLPGELLLQSLRFHILAAGFVLWLVIFVSGARWRSLFLLVPLLAASAHGGAILWDLFGRRTPIAAAPVATVDFQSFNVLVGNRRIEELVQSLVDDPPDVLLVMETPGLFDYRDELSAVFPYHVGCDQREGCDISLWSQLPLENAEIRNLPPFFHPRLALAEVELAGQTLTFVGLHLSKPYFDEASWGELAEVRRALRDIEGPLVMAGDFNAAAWSDPVEWVTRDFALVPGPWTPATWPVRLGPLGVPIDNMFTRGTARIESIAAGDNWGSNHRPLRAEIALYPAD